MLQTVVGELLENFESLLRADVPESSFFDFGKHPRLDDGTTSKHYGGHVVILHVILEAAVVPNVTVADNRNGRIGSKGRNIVPIRLFGVSLVSGASMDRDGAAAPVLEIGQDLVDGRSVSFASCAYLERRGNRKGSKKHKKHTLMEKGVDCSVLDMPMQMSLSLVSLSSNAEPIPLLQTRSMGQPQLRSTKSGLMMSSANCAV